MEGMYEMAPISVMGDGEKDSRLFKNRGLRLFERAQDGLQRKEQEVRGESPCS